MSVLTFPGTGADSADHGRSGVDGISLPTLPVTGAYFGDDGISRSLFLSKSPYTSGSRIHNTTNIVASCLWPASCVLWYGTGQIREPANSVASWYVQSCRAFVVTDTGQIRDRYGTDTGQIRDRYGTDTG